MTQITDAIERSRDYNEIVHVEVDDIAQAVSEARAIARQDGLDCDDARDNEWHEIWAYEFEAPEGEMVWRLAIEQAHA